MVQIGNSIGVVIPALVRKRLGWQKGSKVYIDVAADGKSVIMSKAGEAGRTSSVTPDFLSRLERVNKRYGAALAQLAKL